MRLAALTSPAARPTTLVALALTLLAGTTAVPALAETVAVPALTIPLARSHAPAAALGTGALLKHLPAAATELTFKGESGSRSFTVMLGRTEAARTSVFQIALLNAVSVLPDRSAVKIAINGVVLATIPAAAAEKTAVLPLRIPPGLLVPGTNTVQVSAVLAHRVDCSVKATYELWATLDPARTGFLVPREAAATPTSLDDLAVAPLADDGTTRIHLRMDTGADPDDIGQAGRLIDAVARRAALPRPIVDVGPDLGEGAGFDVILDRGVRGDAAKGVKIVGDSDGVTIGRDVATNRLVLILSAADGPALDRAIATIGKVRAARQQELVGGESRTFADLGIATQNFAGRHYLSTVDIDLPPDFYPANDRATLLVDGSHAGSLVPGSEIVFRVNGTLVSTLPLASGQAERFQHEVVELPLRFFRPGHNELSIEGTTSAAGDQQCDYTTLSKDTRLTIAGSTEFVLPRFARLATLPRLPAALAYDSAPDGGPLHLYLTDPDRTAIGTGLTVLANMALTEDRIGSPVVHLGSPSESDAPGIVIAPANRLPDMFSTALRQVVAPAADLMAAAGDKPAESAAPGPVTGSGASLALRRAAGTVEALLRSRGFFFASDERADLLPAGEQSMLVAAVAPETDETRIGGLRLPHFVQDAAHWLVVTAPDAAIAETGIRRLVASGRWNRLGGQALGLDLRTDEVRTVEPTRLTYVVPNELVLSDVRPIFGGIVSNNIGLSIGLLMGLMSLLGVSTHVLLRRMGAK